MTERTSPPVESYQEAKRKEKQLGGRFRDSLRVNLDALSARNRDIQVDAAMSAAEGYHAIHADARAESKDRQKVQQDKYTVLTNPLRVLAQLDGINHNAGSLDIQMEKGKDWLKRQVGMDVDKDKEEYKETPGYEVRRRAKEIYFDKSKLADLYSADKLKSKNITDKDKAFMIDELPRLFALLSGDHPNPELQGKEDQNGEAHREVVLQELVTALPQISADLQNRLLTVITTIDYGRYSNRFLASLAERTMITQDFAPKWQRVDTEARVTFLEGLSAHDIENVAQVVDLLQNEEDPKVKKALLQYLHKFSQVDGGDLRVPQDKWEMVRYQREEAIRVLSATRFDSGDSGLVGEAIFNLAQSESLADTYGLEDLFYKGDEWTQIQRYEYSSVIALLSNLEGKLGRRTKTAEREDAIKIAKSIFNAVSTQLENVLRATSLNEDELKHAINILIRLRNKFPEAAQKEKRLRFGYSFNLGYQVKGEIREAMKPNQNGKIKIPRAQRRRLQRLSQDIR